MRWLQTRVIVGWGARGVEVVRGAHRDLRPLTAPGIEDPRDADPDDLRQTLRQALAAVHAPAGARVVLVYDSPTTVVDAIRVNVPGAAAARAATLAAMDALPPADVGPSAACPLRSARTTKGETLMLAAAEHASLTDCLRLWVEDCGLRLEALVPTRAVTLAEAAASTSAGAPGDAAELHVGPASSVVIVRDQAGRIELIRGVGIGYEHLGDALQRGSAVAPGDPPRMNLEHALRVLFRTGLPRPEDDLGGGLNGRTLLPALQPVLQRLAIELKQTVRFGLPEGRRAIRRTRLCGGGAGIARLDEFLSNALDSDVSIAGPVSEEPQTPATIVATRGEPLRLIPASVEAARSDRRLRAAAGCGIAAAVAVLAGEGLLVARDLVDARSAVHQLDQQVAAVERRATLDEAVATLRSQLAEADAATSAALGHVSPWGAVLAEVAFASDGRARLTEVAARSERDAQSLVVRGIAIEPPADGGPDPLAALIESLRQSPLVADVRLQGKRASAAGIGGEEFELRVAPVGLPVRVAARKESR